ncbi:hypothetical protein OAA60_01230 [Porticoccaceae bacterium]|nr:hypothetical protein [bacterium]MDB4352038.1 hypothetical protein [Porticoccaceae bacterium]
MSSLSFASTSSFRNALMGVNLPPYNVPGTYTSPVGPLTYPTQLSSYSVVDSPDFLIANSPFPNQSYVLNEFGPTGGFNNTINFNGPLIPTIPTYAEYSPNQTNMDILNDTFIDAAYIQNSYGPQGGYQYMVDITDIQLNNFIYQPYWDPPNFAPSSYSPYNILFSDNPQGDNGPLSQDSYLARLGAEQLKTTFQNRVDAEIYQNTVGLVNLDSLQDPFEASLIATGKEPLIYRNWRITVPENPILQAADFVTRLGGAYWPVSPIPGDYFDEPNFDSKQTSNALNVVNQLTGGFLGPILNKRRQPSQVFIANTGNGQRSALFRSLEYNRYQPGFSKDFGGLLGIGQGLVNLVVDLINPNNGTLNGGYYVGNKDADPSTITSPPNQVPVNAFGQQEQVPVYGPSEMGKLYEGNIDSLNFGLAGKSFTDGGGITGEFVWVSPKYKPNAGFRATPGGASGSKDEDWDGISSQFTRGESTNLTFKETSILDQTQRLVDSADNVSGIARLKHVGNAINQVSKVFNDGYKEITKGSQVLSYTDNSDGSQAGIEYCRVFTKDTPYYTYNDLQKTEGIVDSGRKFNNSVLKNTFNLNIAPTSENVVEVSPKNFIAKKYMFSIENLAWRTSSKPGFRYDDLPNCEKGPNGGRVMWFPPYDIDFSESNTANWNSTSFLGRPEPMYTYKDTTRTGSLKWKIIVDHPSVMNLIVKKQLEGVSKDRVNSMLDSFFAGCLKYDLYDLGVKFNTIPSSDLFTYQEILSNNPTEEEVVNIIDELPKGPSKDDKKDNVDLSLSNFKKKYDDVGFYFENDTPDPNTDNTTSSVPFNETYGPYTSQSNISKYVAKANGLFNDGDSERNVQEFFDSVVIDNFNTISNNPESNFIKDAFDILKEKKARVNITLVGSASAPASQNYNVNLSKRRVDSVKQFLSETSSGDANLSQFFDDGTIKVESKGEMETIVFPKGNTSDSGNTFGSEINCTKNIEDKDKRTNRGSQIYSVNAMACRRVSILIETIPLDPVTTTTTTEVPKKTIVKKNNYTKTIQEKLKSGIGKRILRSLLSECDYFEVIQQENPMVYDSIREKIKYFNPAFHSMTPEGLNGRLTFLNQCLRPGETIPIVRTDSNGNDTLVSNDAINTSFGTPPILVLRIGDFYNSKIVPKSINITYNPLNLDLNPEGIGVQPMIAEITMSFDFIGGQGLTRPVEQLQNALSFNFFANTEVYDERAVATEDRSTLDRELIQRIVDTEEAGTFKGDNNIPNPGGNTIGVVMSEETVSSGYTGTITYKKVMDDLLGLTNEYYVSIPNKIETFINEHNFGIWELISKNRRYIKGNGKIPESIEVDIYGKPENTQKNIDNLFEFLINDIKFTDNGPPTNYIITNLEGLGFSVSVMNEVTNNMVNYVNDYKVEFSSPIFTKINEITEQQQNMVQTLREVNLISQKFDGKIPSAGIPFIYNTVGTDNVDSSTPAEQSIENTFDELSYDYKEVLNQLNLFYRDLLVGEDTTNRNMEFITLNGSNYDAENGLFSNQSEKILNPADQHMFMVLSNVFNNSDKLDNFIDFVISGRLSKMGKLKRNFRKFCESFSVKVKDELKEEQKLITKFKEEPKYQEVIKESVYVKGKTREFDYSTVVIPTKIEQQQKDIQELYKGVGGDKWDGVVKLT